MDLILWRHAEAEDPMPGQADIERALTSKGVKQAAKMGKWLDAHLPSSCRILASPAVRTVQTAEALGRKFKTHPGLAPDVTPQSVLEAVNWPDSKEPVLVVGHQPTLGQTMALLIAGTRQDWTLRKSNVCWIAQRAPGEADTVYIKLLLGPDLASR
ncbi:histidine phosphatase family protein [Oxalobacteraceae bacterium OM1]|nr:histidine phosphatase family protein [Oxalobacteraceae bacterium OM1]